MMTRRFVGIVCGLLALAVVCLPQGEKASPALASLVEAERAFARASVERGVRDSFIEFFAEDGIGFQPGPVKARAAFLSRPAPAAPPPVTLDWFPVHGDVSATGDLGYTTGPYVRTDNSPQKRPPAYGYYFSVWRKQADGAWKVALDLGIPTPALDLAAPGAKDFSPARRTGWKPGRGAQDAPSARDELLAAERAFAGAALTDGVERAFAGRVLDDARFYHSGALPVVGAKAISAYLSANVAKFSWDVTDAGAARSGDFGYTYGSYELVPAIGKGDGKTETGYFARVWKRDARGRWRAAMSVTHAAPPGQN
ncbi:MAG TPA: nuclear transport factor 2 family protein [Pyrinomonadaceae bacterium]|jgi:ketosteroid isomerase-like protein